MNTLEFYGTAMFALLDVCVRFARNWMRGERPRMLIDWVQVFFYGALLIDSTVSVLILLTHPDQIQPAPVWQSVLGFFLAFTIFALLIDRAVAIARRIRPLAR